MTGFFEIFNPGQRYWREQQDYDKIAVVPTKKGGRGPLQIDLDGGTVVVPTMVARRAAWVRHPTQLRPSPRARPPRRQRNSVPDPDPPR